MKKLLLQLLVLSALTQAQINANAVPLHTTGIEVINNNIQPIFVKNTIDAFHTGKSSVINIGQSDSYNQRIWGNSGIYLRIFNNTSNSGPYLYINASRDGNTEGIIEIFEYNSSGTIITDYHEIRFPYGTTSGSTVHPKIRIKPAQTKSGLAVEIVDVVPISQQ